MRQRSVILLALTLLILAAGVSACGSGGKGEQKWSLAPESALPAFVVNAPTQLKEAYRFAIAHPDTLRAFPCYCGCGAMGHENNLDCYIKEIRSDGSIEFENHAFG